MKRLVLITLMALGTAIGGSAAVSAAPTTTSVAGVGEAQSGIVLARDRRDGGYRRHGNWRRNGYRGDYRGGDRYRGWHRYHSRPSGWRSRGCVIVGPVWVCP